MKNARLNQRHRAVDFLALWGKELESETRARGERRVRGLRR